MSNVPDSMLMAGVGIALLFAGVFVFFLLFFSTDYMRSEHKEHKDKDSHKLIMDLQHTLIQEMRGTSKQNSLMINLTILFIAISVFGIAVTMFGPQVFINMFKQLIRKGI